MVTSRYDSQENKLANYHRAMRWLNKNRRSITTSVSRIGAPIITKAIPTAAVTMRANGKGKIKFLLNNDFFDGLTDGQVATGVTHEFYHVLLRHLHQQGDRDRFPNKTYLTIAQEIVINDSLTLSGHEKVEGIMYGRETIEKFCGYMTTEEAYDAVEEYYKNNPEKDPSKQKGNSDSNSSGTGSGIPAEGGEPGSGGSPQDGDQSDHDHIDGACGGIKVEDKDGTIRDATEEEAQKIAEKIFEQIKDALPEIGEDGTDLTEEQLEEEGDEAKDAVTKNNNSAKSKGDEAGAQSIMRTDEKLQLGWVELLQKINPKVGKAGAGINQRASYDWSMRPRTLVTLPRNIKLPRSGDPRGDGIGAGIVPEVLIALDFSGSIPRELAKVMASLARSIPSQHIDPTCYTFSTEAIFFDHTAEENMTASGGTDFSCIHDAAVEMQQKSRKKEYPYVMCLTDGYANFSRSRPTDTELTEKWLWVDVTKDENSIGEPFSDMSYSGFGSEVRNSPNKYNLPYDLDGVYY